MYKNVLFDLDGTLTDPGVGITNAVAYALKKFDITEKDRHKLDQFIGPPLQESFRELYGFSPEACEQAVVFYREYFRDRGIFENEVYPGIPELLASLKAGGFRVLLATSKPEEFAKRILIHFDLDRYFDFVAGATMDSSRSAKADVIAYAMRETGIENRSEAVMVGDRKHDIIGAKENELDSIGVLFGYGSLDELQTAGATHIAANPEDIWEILNRG